MEGIGIGAVGQDEVTSCVTVTTVGEPSPVVVSKTDIVVVPTVLVRVTTTVSPLSPDLMDGYPVPSEVPLVEGVGELPPVSWLGETGHAVGSGWVSVTDRGAPPLTPVAVDEPDMSAVTEVVAIGSKDSTVVSNRGESTLLADLDGVIDRMAGEDGVGNRVDVRSVESPVNKVDVHQLGWIDDGVLEWRYTYRLFLGRDLWFWDRPARCSPMQWRRVSMSSGAQTLRPASWGRRLSQSGLENLLWLSRE